jgi:ABC-type lipoprotein release transport system permease subunit
LTVKIQLSRIDLVESKALSLAALLVTAIVTLSTVAALASFLRTYRASKLDPLTALRYE